MSLDHHVITFKMTGMHCQLNFRSYSGLPDARKTVSLWRTGLAGRRLR